MFEVFNIGFPPFGCWFAYRGLQRRRGETDLQKLVSEYGALEPMDRMVQLG
jgi:hypothetical protein